MRVDALELISDLQARLIETNKALIALQAEVLKLRTGVNVRLMDTKAFEIGEGVSLRGGGRIKGS